MMINLITQDMEIPAHRIWMTNRLILGRRGCTHEFIRGVEEFDTFARLQPVYLREGKYRCPCSKCKNKKYLISTEVKVHLYKRGFMYGYWYWTSHGEVEPNVEVNMHHGSSSMDVEHDDYNGVDRLQTMVDDIMGVHQENEYEPPNPSAQRFYDKLNAAQRPLWPGCNNHTELSLALRMMSIKSDYNMSQSCFDEVAQLMKEACPPTNFVPSNFSEAKKLVKKLGLSVMKIDSCRNGCMLYFKDDESLEKCKFCDAPRWQASKSSKWTRKKVPFARMHYFPLIPRLQRLYVSRSSAEHMRWHHVNRREEGVMCHPSDGEAWKEFDQLHTDFAS